MSTDLLTLLMSPSSVVPIIGIATGTAVVIAVLRGARIEVTIAGVRILIERK